jgi:hypothetical protein
MCVGGGGGLTGDSDLNLKRRLRPLFKIRRPRSLYIEFFRLDLLLKRAINLACSYLDPLASRLAPPPRRLPFPLVHCHGS